MRRLISIGAFALFLTLPLWAQRGGHAGGFGGGHMGGSHFSGGMRSAPAVSHSFSRTPSFSQRSSSNRSVRYDGSRHNNSHHDGYRRNHYRTHYRTYGFRNNCYGYDCRGYYGYPWAYAGYYDPFWCGDSGYSYDEDYERDRAIANEMNEQSLEQQHMLRQEEADGNRDLYARSGSRSGTNDPRSANEPQGTPLTPATVLVFRDQHEKEIENYAIIGQTLWNFAPQHTEKIPLADLDLQATTKANDDRGITFRVPTANEAQ
jgi:hypothetical protein